MVPLNDGEVLLDPQKSISTPGISVPGAYQELY
jgi:hypothetical protein